jgi:hypothetical protein
MFKCQQCGQQQRKCAVQFQRRKYQHYKDNLGNPKGKDIVFVIKVCNSCFDKFGEEII